MNNEARNKNNSLCEKSMKMATNIVKLSSFYIAKMSLGTTQVAAGSVSAAAASQPLLPQFPGSQMSQKPESGLKKPLRYLIEPVEGNETSSYVIREAKGVDEDAAAFIRKVRAKNQSDSYGTSTLSPYRFPPPPRIRS